MTEWVIETHDLTKIYQMGDVEVHALNGLSVNIARGEVVAIMGPSGSGKSTLMNIIGCLDTPTGGEYQLDAERVTHLRTEALSYFSRLTDATTFQRLALVETHRRGVETAGAVGAVTDGAEWCQSFIDFHRPDAVRILDFPPAGEHLAQIGQAVFGEGTPATDAWFTQQLHHLNHDGPTAVLAEVRQLAQAHADCPEVLAPVAYLEKREAHLQYPAFQAAGWPIGDGAVESGNKLVVEARLKGSGMHWGPLHVDPMLALRNLACNDRWVEGWNKIVGELRRQTRQRSR